MDEAKAAAYYDELTRKGGGAAKFKQGLGFSSSGKSTSRSSDPLPSDATNKSSFYANFIPAAPPQPSSSGQTSSRRCVEEICDKLKKKQGMIDDDRRDRRSYDDDRHANRDRQTRESSRYRSPKRESYRRNVVDDGESRSRSTRSRDSRRRSPSDDDEGRSPRRSRGGDQCEHPSDGRRRRSPVLSNRSSGREKVSSGRRGQNKRRDTVDYSRLIDGYSGMVRQLILSMIHIGPKIRSS